LTQASLYTHHQYIAVSSCGAFLQELSSLFVTMIEANKGNVLARMLEHKDNYFSLKLGFFILGFHTLGLYVHNDVMQAFGTPENKF
jgi:photosystem I P700 chlorophyll a apoprotein A2